jgi:hypothetical protein
VERFDPDLLDDEWPFEIDHQVSHLFKHPQLGVDDVEDIWASEPLFYPPSHRPIGSWWPKSGGGFLMVPLPPSTSGDPSRCRPIGFYLAADHLARRFREHR